MFTPSYITRILVRVCFSSGAKNCELFSTLLRYLQLFTVPSIVGSFTIDLGFDLIFCVINLLIITFA